MSNISPMQNDGNIEIQIEQITNDINSTNFKGCTITQFATFTLEEIIQKDEDNARKLLAIQVRCKKIIATQNVESPEEGENSQSTAIATKTNDDMSLWLSSLLANGSEEKLKKGLARIHEDIPTGYNIGDIDLCFPGGALSLIVASTGHGKTAALINFSLGILEHNKGKNVHFFTYEEPDASIATLFLNTYINTDLSKNNRASLKKYFQRNTEEYINKDKIEIFRTEKNNFFNNLINNGRLRITYSDRPIEELTKGIYHIKDNDPNIGAICIDYMQLLTSSDKSHGTRQQELKDICKQLEQVAIQTGLPIIIAAQFNRAVTSQAEMSLGRICEAGDIERKANLVIGLWNLMYNENAEKKIYMKVFKGRGIGIEPNSIFRWDGNAGKITMQNNNVPDILKQSGYTNTAKKFSDITGAINGY